MANNSNLNLRYNVGDGLQKIFIDGTSVNGTESDDIDLKYLLGVGYKSSGIEESRQQPEARLVCVGKSGIIPNSNKCVITRDKIHKGVNIDVQPTDDGGVEISANVERFNVYTLESDPTVSPNPPSEGTPYTDLSDVNKWTGNQYLKLFEIKEDKYQIPENPDDGDAELDPMHTTTTPFWIKLPEIDNSKNVYQISSAPLDNKAVITLSGQNSGTSLGSTAVNIVPGTNVGVSASSSGNNITINHEQLNSSSTLSYEAETDKYIKSITLGLNNGHVTSLSGTPETLPKVTFSTVGNSQTRSVPIAMTATTSGTVGTIVTSAGDNKLRFTPSSGSLNGAKAYYADSDRSLKENITNVNTPENILDVPIVEFDWKDTKAHSVGVIAQDLEKVAPMAVSTSDSTGLKSVNYTTFLLLRIAALEKELKEIKDKLKIN